MNLQAIAAATHGKAVTSAAKPRVSVEAFIAKNLKVLAQELLVWKNTGRLPNRGEGTLFEVGVKLVTTSDPYRDFEAYIVNACIAKVAGK